MPNICLPPKIVDKFTEALKSGKIDPSKLSSMTSEARHKFFKDLVGEDHAKTTNALFESKMLLKNQKYAYVSWAKKVAGITPEVRRDLITRIGKLDHILNPVDEKRFLKDLASTRLGMDVTQAEAKKIALMSNRVTELQAKQRADGTFPSEADRMAFGYAQADLGNHISELTNKANKISFGEGLLHHPAQTVSKVAGFTKSIKAAFDDSALLRQNWKTLLTHPGIWLKNTRKNIIDLKRQGINNQDIIREVKADLYSRPNAREYQKMGINIGKTEEEFGDPTLIHKIPVVGRLYKTTENAFTAVLYRSRADLADRYLEIARKTGVDLNKDELKSIGELVNAMTGRGSLGRFEGRAAETFNNVFFSARYVKSQIDTVGHVLTGAGGSNFVRKQAAINLVKMISATAGIFALANGIKPHSVELDPRSKNFGKIKVGDTTFDVTGGFSSIAVLATQLYKQERKSASTGIITKFSSGFGGTNGDNVVQNFITGKLSPAAAFVNDNFIRHADFHGNKPTIVSNIRSLIEPLPMSTFTEAHGDPHGANALLAIIADGIGLAANTNNPAKDLKQSLSGSDGQLLKKIGDEKFQQYNDTYNQKVDNFVNSDTYKNVSDDKKAAALTYAKSTIKKNLYKQYGFKPTSAKQDKSLNQSIINAVR